MRILVAAGASGGHVYPALATAIVLRDRGHDVAFAGGDRIEARIVPEAGFELHALPVRRPPSVRSELLTPRGLVAMGSIGLATLKARSLIGRLRPDVVLGMGGFASVPVALAASFGRSRVVLHEQNAHLSLAQRIPLRRADVLALGFPIEEGTSGIRTELVGNPVRDQVVALHAIDDAARPSAQRDARTRLGLDPDAVTLAVIGGSLGAGPLNDVMPTVALPDGVQVLHISGPAREDATRAAYASVPHAARVRVVGFSDAIQDVYAAADLAVCRSGAATVAELAIAGLPAVLVPLLTLARGDQAANARVLQRAGGAVIVDQAAADFASQLGAHVARLLADEGARSSMRNGARTAARPDAAARLADVVESLAR